MTPLGLGLLVAISALFMVWVLNLVRTGRLYVGYAVLAVTGTSVGLLAIGARPLRRFATGMLGQVFPTTGIVMALTIFVGIALVYVLAQLTILSNRVAAMAQELAIQSARNDQSVGGGAQTKQIGSAQTS